MREFPSKFTPSNLVQFNQYKYDRDICYLREAIYEHYLLEKPELKGDELRPFELAFNLQGFFIKHQPLRFSEMIKTICSELEKLGWKTVVGYNNNALWVYPAIGNPPKSLPDW